MPFNALVVRVLIASPSDTSEARRSIEGAIDDWNSLHAEDTGVILLPVLWERDATPEMGDRAQGVINRQLVDVTDVLVATFWTRLGTPTGEADSGTAEEIHKCIDASRAVHVFFSSEPVVPASIDSAEYERLQAFRKELENQGLLDTFTTQDELRRKVTATLTRTVRDRFKDQAPDPLALLQALGDSGPTSRTGASLLGTLTRERELRDFDKKGKPRYRTRERLVLENRGTAPALDVSITAEVPDGLDGVPPHILSDHPVNRLPAGGSIEIPIATSMGSAPRWDLVVRWREEDGGTGEERQTMS